MLQMYTENCLNLKRFKSYHLETLKTNIQIVRQITIYLYPLKLYLWGTIICNNYFSKHIEYIEE